MSEPWSSSLKDLLRSGPGRGLLAVCLAFLALRTPLPASAQSSDDRVLEQEQEQIAADLTRQAQTHYYAGEFEAARDKYQEAYRRAPRPELVFDIAQCHRRLGQHRAAIFFFELYLQQRPYSPQSGLARSLIGESEMALLATDTVPSGGVGDGVSASEGAAQVAPRSAQPSPVESRRDAERQEGERRRRTVIAALSAVIVAGAGAALAVTLAGREQSTDPPESSLGIVRWH